jgi:TctA family transporter
MALILASLVMYDIIPGPLVMDTKPMLFWGVIVSFLMANILIFLLNYPLVFLWISFLKVNQKILIAIISVICLIGVYKVNNNINDIFFLLLPLTIIGYLLRLLQFDLTPILLGFVIGPLFEKYFVRSLFIHNNDITIFLSSPISLICLVASAAILYKIFTQKICNVNKLKTSKSKE